MRISELLRRATPFLSLEFFPPKDKLQWPDFFKAVEKLRALHPLFVSVTYGAMGSTRANTLEIVSRLKNDFGLETMAHLTCIGASRESLSSFLDELVDAGVDNVLALRGDLPQEGAPRDIARMDFQCASDLVAYIRGHYPSLGIGVAAYPEGHPEASSREEDLSFLKRKLETGADFAITQLFFDNDYYWEFMRRAKGIGIDKPIIPGILPIFNLGNVQKIISLSNARIPAPLHERFRKAMESGGPAAVKMLGIRHAAEQARGLIDGGAPGVHLYTLNKADACLEIAKRLHIPT